MKEFAVYIAGPEVFQEHASAVRFCDLAEELCAKLGMKALLPYDEDLTQAEEVNSHNLTLMRRADGMVSNGDPFRGVDLDTGAAFEIGFMRALGKPVVNYFLDNTSMEKKVLKHFGVAGAFAEQRGDPMPDKMLIPGWGLRTNLMIAHNSTQLRGGLYPALIQLRAELVKAQGSRYRGEELSDVVLR